MVANIHFALYLVCYLLGNNCSSTTVNVWIDYGMHVLEYMFTKMTNPVWKISWPTADEMELSFKLLENNRKYGPILKGVFAIMDGARFKNTNYVNTEIQNDFYNGFNFDVEITNLLF